MYSTSIQEQNYLGQKNHAVTLILISWNCFQGYQRFWFKPPFEDKKILFILQLSMGIGFWRVPTSCFLEVNIPQHSGLTLHCLWTYSQHCHIHFSCFLLCFIHFCCITCSYVCIWWTQLENIHVQGVSQEGKMGVHKKVKIKQKITEQN